MKGKLLLISATVFGLTFDLKIQDKKIYNLYSYSFICKTSDLLYTNMKTWFCNFFTLALASRVGACLPWTLSIVTAV